MCLLLLAKCGCEIIPSLRPPNLHQYIPCVLYLKRDKKRVWYKSASFPVGAARKKSGEAHPIPQSFF